MSWWLDTTLKGRCRRVGRYLIRTSSAQEAFYRLSAEFKEDYLESDRLQFLNGVWLHPEAKLGSGVQLAPGAVIGNCVLGDDVSIGAHAVIHAKTHIGNGTSIGASTVVGTAGMMWVWGGPDGREKVFLEQLGSVTIGEGCRIGSNISIVRGNANEETVFEDGVCVAHSMIGHGSGWVEMFTLRTTCPWMCDLGGRGLSREWKCGVAGQIVGGGVHSRGRIHFGF